MRPRRLGAFCPWGGHRMALCFLMAFSTAWLAVWRQTSLLHETIWTPETQSPSVPLESEHEEAPEPDALPPALDEEGEESKGAPEEEALSSHHHLQDSFHESSQIFRMQRTP
eukprot:g13079.t1